MVFSVCPSVGPSVLMSRPDPAVLPVGTLHPLEWFWVSRRIFIYSHHNTFVFSLRRPFVHGLFVSWGATGWRFVINSRATSMSQMTVQQSYLLCWELLPDRNRISMSLWYWELTSRPDPAVLPVGTLHSLEWFWVSRRIFIYSHHNTFVFSLRCPSVRLSVCHTFLTMFPSSYHHEIFRSYYQWPK